MRFSGLPGHIGLFWLPAGISLAALLLGGLRLAPGVALGAFAVQLSVGGGLWMSAAFALGSTGSALCGAWLLDRKLAFSRALNHPRDVLSLMGIGASLSPVIAATIGTTAVYWGHAAHWQDQVALWAVWWAGDALGVLLLAPVLLSWFGARAEPIKLGRPILALAALQLLVGIYVFALRGGPDAGAYVYLTLALLTAMHLPLRWVAVINLLTFGAAAASTLLGTGPFGEAATQDALLSLQAYGIVSSLAALLVSSLAQEREKVTAELGEGKHFLDALINAIPAPVLVKDQQHRYIAVNPSFCRFFGNRIEDILGKTDYDFFAPEDAAYYQETDLRALAGGPPVEYEHRYTVSAGKRWMLVRKSALTRPDGSPRRGAGSDQRHRASRGRRAVARKRATLPQPDGAVCRLVLGTGCATALHFLLRPQQWQNRHPDQRADRQDPAGDRHRVGVRGCTRAAWPGAGCAPALQRPAVPRREVGTLGAGQWRARVRRVGCVRRLPRRGAGHDGEQARAAAHRALEGHVRRDERGQRRHRPQHRPAGAVRCHLPHRGGVRSLCIRARVAARFRNRAGGDRCHGRGRQGSPAPRCSVPRSWHPRGSGPV